MLRINNPEHRYAVCVVAKAMADRSESAVSGTGLASVRWNLAQALFPVVSASLFGNALQAAGRGRGSG